MGITVGTYASGAKLTFSKFSTGNFPYNGGQNVPLVCFENGSKLYFSSLKSAPALYFDNIQMHCLRS